MRQISEEKLGPKNQQLLSHNYPIEKFKNATQLLDYQQR